MDPNLNTRKGWNPAIMVEPIRYDPSRDEVEIIDQTKLPGQKKLLVLREPEQMAHAIRTLQLRGAPAIGVGAAYGIYLGMRNFSGSPDRLRETLEKVCSLMGSTRPTAVNLFWAIDRVNKVVSEAIANAGSGDAVRAARTAALGEARAIQEEDANMCRTIGAFGADFLEDGQTWLTHCNAGALATAAYGTALGVFRAAKEQGKRFRVFVDETRPLLQGARLTAWELLEDGIDATLICDNMAGTLMAAGKVHGVVVGADRITADGFVANKIGTYPLAVLAKYHSVPFYVAAPVSTFDLTIRTGDQIPIEERDHTEVTGFGGVRTAPEGIKVFNPAFDTTPPKLVKAIITDRGVLTPPFRSAIKRLVPRLDKR